MSPRFFYINFYIFVLYKYIKLYIKRKEVEENGREAHGSGRCS